MEFLEDIFNNLKLLVTRMNECMDQNCFQIEGDFDKKMQIYS